VEVVILRPGEALIGVGATSGLARVEQADGHRWPYGQVRRC
jgi:hypothetical protein